MLIKGACGLRPDSLLPWIRRYEDQIFAPGPDGSPTVVGYAPGGLQPEGAPLVAESSPAAAGVLIAAQ